MLKSLSFTLVYWVIRALAGTYRFRCATARPRPAGAYVLAIWHQNLFSGILAQAGHRHCVIVSRSLDGDAVTFLCNKYGHAVVRGSSRRNGRDKGGKPAKDEMIGQLAGGVPGAVTIDGPKGPAHEVKPGIVEMARLSGVPIVPYLTMPRRYWSFPSWDAFRLPMPFTRIDVRYGAPIFVRADTAFEDFPRYQLMIARALEALQLGRMPVAAVPVALV